MTCVPNQDDIDRSRSIWALISSWCGFLFPFIENQLYSKWCCFFHSFLSVALLFWLFEDKSALFCFLGFQKFIEKSYFPVVIPSALQDTHISSKQQRNLYNDSFIRPSVDREGQCCLNDADRFSSLLPGDHFFFVPKDFETQFLASLYPSHFWHLNWLHEIYW